MRISWVEESAVSCGAIPISIENLEALKEQGVSAIVTLTEHPLTSQKALTSEAIADMGFETLHVPVVDQHPPTEEQVQRVLDFVQQMKGKQKPVYLHCHAGIGRTGTMLHAIYLLSGMEFETVKQRIKTTRPASQFFMLSETQQAFLEKLAEKPRA